MIAFWYLFGSFFVFFVFFVNMRLDIAIIFIIIVIYIYLYYLIKCSCMSKVSSLYTVRVICGFAVVSFNLSTNGE